MSLMEITAETLTQDLGQPVPDMYVVIAKHSVMDMSADDIARVLGCQTHDVQEVESNELYKQVRTIIGAIYSQTTLDTGFTWDAVEASALTNLMKRVPHEKDTDVLLRIAAVANKAQRRTPRNPEVLDPSKAGRTVITLTQRLVNRITRGGTEIAEERQLSISDGSMTNPSFDDIDSMLNVSGRPILPHNIEIKTAMASPNLDDLTREMKSKGF